MKNKFLQKMTVFLGTIVVFLGIAQIILSGYIGAQGKEFALLEERIQNLKRVNQELEEEIAFHSSLQRIKEEAVNLGFKPDYLMVDYSSEKPVALR